MFSQARSRWSTIQVLSKDLLERLLGDRQRKVILTILAKNENEPLLPEPIFQISQYYVVQYHEPHR